MTFLSFSRLLTTPSSFAPGSVTKASAFGRCQRSRKSSDEKRKRQPDRQVHRGFAGFIKIGLDLSDHIASPLVRVGLAEDGPGGDHFVYIAVLVCRGISDVAIIGCVQALLVLVLFGITG